MCKQLSPFNKIIVKPPGINELAPITFVHLTRGKDYEEKKLKSGKAYRYLSYGSTCEPQLGVDLGLFFLAT